jgi:hypothetical protein
MNFSFRFQFRVNGGGCRKVKWVSDCLMPTQQFFNYIMARTSYFQWDVDEVHFVLDQHTKLDFYSASSFKQQSVDRLTRTHYPDS